MPLLQKRLAYNTLKKVIGLILSLTVVLVIVLAVPVAYGDTWSLLDSPEMMDGTTMTYEICDSLMLDEYTGAMGGCYTTTLSFHDTIYTDFALYLVVSARTEIDEVIRDELFLIDTRTFEIKNIDKRSQISDSLSRTLFWIGKISTDVTLKEGALVSDMKSYFPEGIPLMVQKKVTKDDHIQYVLGYRLFKDSTITIIPSLQLPLSAEIYSTTHIYPEPSKMFEFKYVNQHITKDSFSFDVPLQEEDDYNNEYSELITTNEISNDFVGYDQQDLTNIITQDIGNLRDSNVDTNVNDENNNVVTQETIRGFYDIETQRITEYTSTEIKNDKNVDDPLPEIKNNVEYTSTSNTSTSQNTHDYSLPEIKNRHYSK